VTLFDKSARKDGTERTSITIHPAGGVYIYPGGKMLTTTGTRVNDGENAALSSEQGDCGSIHERARTSRGSGNRPMPPLDPT
jgi:hypothetical protein